MYRTILVHLHDPARTAEPVRLAAGLAAAMRAHVVGLGVIPPYVVMPAMDAVGASVSVDEHRRAFKSDLGRMEAMFKDATGGLDSPSEWREADAEFASVTDLVLRHARGADLVVAAAPEPGKSKAALFEDPLRLVMECGRPVLLVPKSTAAVAPPRRAVVAWNGGREAARALFDAMPLLERADEVTLLWVDPVHGSPAAGDLPGADVAPTLARHGIKCQVVETTSDGGDTGAEIMRQAKVLGADLLVMGCYGHSRIRELILGGASRHAFEHMSIPVLMSH